MSRHTIEDDLQYELSCLESERENQLSRDDIEKALEPILDEIAFELEQFDPYNYNLILELQNATKEDIK